MSFKFASLLKPLQFYIGIIHKQRSANFNLYKVLFIISFKAFHHFKLPFNIQKHMLKCKTFVKKWPIIRG